MTYFTNVLGLTTGEAVQEFKTSGIWERPYGVTHIVVFLVGGGGGGAAASSTIIDGDGTSEYYSAGGSGGGGAFVHRVLPVTGDLSITIGSGGAGGGPLPSDPALADSGKEGGDSVIQTINGTTLLTARGGGAGGAPTYGFFDYSFATVRATEGGDGTAKKATNNKIAIQATKATGIINGQGHNGFGGPGMRTFISVGYDETPLMYEYWYALNGGGKPGWFIENYPINPYGGYGTPNTGGGGGGAISTPDLGGVNSGGGGGSGYCLIKWQP